jgi:hypothetical protein
MDFAFKLSNITNEKLKIKKHMYISMLNEQRRIMYMLQQQNALIQQNMAVVVPATPPEPAPAPITSTNKKVPKKGFNVVFSKVKQ